MSTFDPRSTLQGLDSVCTTCKRPIGDHTLREWQACTTEAGHHDPFHPASDADRQAIAASWDGEDLTLTDHVDFVAAAVQVELVGMEPLYVPMVVMTFGVGTPDGPERVAGVAYTGTVESMRATGTAIRDACRAAAHKAESRSIR